MHFGPLADLIADVNTQGYGGADTVNITTVGFHVGMLMATPRIANDGYELVLEPKSNWTQNMMICASATRASIKTVTFIANGTALQDIQVARVSDKVYPDEASMPLWAIENSDITIKNDSPLWGIVDDKYENSNALQTRRKEHLWLPAGMAFDKGQCIHF